MECPICHVRENVVCVDVPLNVYRCSACTHRFSVVAKEEEESYDEAYFLRTHRNWFANPDHRHFARLLRLLEKRENSTLSVLDIGCGNGDLLKFLRDRNETFRLTGIDLIGNEYREVTFIKGDVYETDFGERYDAVVCLHTIEHVPDPQRLLSIMRELLKPGGLLVICTIDSSSPIHGIAGMLKTVGLRTAYDRIFSRHHLHHFTSLSLRTLVEAHGFRVTQHYNYNHPLKAVDVPEGNMFMRALYKTIVFLIFTAGRPFRKGMLQTLVAEKTET